MAKGNASKNFTNKILHFFVEMNEKNKKKNEELKLAKGKGTEREYTGRQLKRMARKTASKEIHKHYSGRGIKHFGTFSPIKPLNW